MVSLPAFRRPFWRLAWLVVGACLGVYVMPSSLVGADRPPKVVVSKGACPFEGCQYGPWVARNHTVLYQRPNGSLLKWRVERGEHVTALGGEVWARPVLARIVESSDADARRGLKAGTRVYVLYPLGEGAMAMWRNGKVEEGAIDLEFDVDDLERTLDYTWWVRLRLADGSIGWVKDTDFDGTDAFA